MVIKGIFSTDSQCHPTGLIPIVFHELVWTHFASERGIKAESISISFKNSID